MKTKHAAFIAVAVIFRTASLAVVLLGLFAVLMPVATLGGRLSLELGIGLLRMFLMYSAAGFVLWLISKPAASLVVRGLPDPRFDLDDFRQQ